MPTPLYPTPDQHPPKAQGAAPPFVHLHVHTEFSLLDGAIRIPKLVAKAARLGMEAVAVTDHGNLFGAVQLADAARQAGIRPLIGSEVYLAPDDRRNRSRPADGSPVAFHLVLLVTSDEGYANLCQLITRAHLEGFYYHPRVDLELLREHHAGLIALSACLKGPVTYYAALDRMDLARAKAIELARIFDHERFFLEVQANNLPEQNRVNPLLAELAADLSLPLVATNDCHYLDREDSAAHDVLLCIQTGKTVDDENRLRFSADEFYFKTVDEMRAVLPGFDEALANTLAVARRCDYEMEFGRYKYPVFHTEGHESLEERLRREAEHGLETRLRALATQEGPLSAERHKEYHDRLVYELDVICSMGFAGYFLIVGDFIAYARSRDIPVGPGRGSAAGSLVAYALAITNIDPLKYGLLFERFLNPQRISMPDIDVDFCMNGRDEVIRYVTEKYGREDVAQIITFGSMKARGVIRDVGRALNIPLKEVDRIAKMVPEGPGVTLEQALREEPELGRLATEEGPAQRLLKVSRALEGLSRHASTHASGIVISDRPLVAYVPLYKGSRDEIMTQFPMDQIEKLGLIKFDFLGLKTLTVIHQALTLIRSTTGRALDVEKIPLDDAAAYQLCSEGRTTGVFQLESSGMKELLRRLRPSVFEDLIALVALYRPGPLGSHMVDDFVDRKHGRVPLSYFLPELEPILKDTYGVILYQEQVMKMAQILAHYSLGEADELRKAIGKKKPEVMARHRARFIEGAVAGTVKPATAEMLFNLIENFGGYGFNKSHSAAYALIAYQTAYLKAHFPVQFMAALLSQDMGNQDKTIKNIAECREMGIAILPPDINESQADFSVVDNQIRFGLAAVKNVGLKAVESSIAEREANGPFRDLLDFCRRVDGSKVNRRVLEGLIQCGAFDFTGIYRARLFAALDAVTRLANAGAGSSQLSIFGGLETGGGMEAAGLEWPAVDEWDEAAKLRQEKAALGFYVTGHPLRRYAKEIGRYATCSVQDLAGQPDKSTVRIAGMAAEIKIKRTQRKEKMATLKFEDQTGFTEVILWPDLFSRASQLLKDEEPLLITGVVEVSENAAKVIARELRPLAEIRQEELRNLELSLEQGSVSRDLLQELVHASFEYPGHCRLLFNVRLADGEAVLIRAHDRFRVTPCAELIQRLESLTGHRVVAW